MRAVILRPEARRDALQAFRWYEARSRGLGVEFRCALDATFERIASHPETYREHERGLRHALVRRFPYAICFRLVDDFAVVVGIIHTRRHPGVVKAR